MTDLALLGDGSPLCDIRFQWASDYQGPGFPQYQTTIDFKIRMDPSFDDSGHNMILEAQVTGGGAGTWTTSSNLGGGDGYHSSTWQVTGGSTPSTGLTYFRLRVQKIGVGTSDLLTVLNTGAGPNLVGTVHDEGMGHSPSEPDLFCMAPTLWAVGVVGFGVEGYGGYGP